ncbi:hypothetical protein AMATHDRAFT_135865 [Amanita thiersii Skay4041]|uniref:DUF7918 domain-containing protein n=1 Tax=Amanita thiersii Skay4041 TaxID=703135 RepID=A0A2A9NTA3_9AGAR|nr:hypothetical protein AMATHDRAFT_135865 [Amanita thiersii Skay4041]
MLNHYGFSAWIEVDGKELPEYLVAVDNETNRVSCWIPGEEGQPFSVHWKDHGGQVDTCTYITLDGFVVPGKFLFGEGTAYRQGVRTSRTTERPFLFQKVTHDAMDGNAAKDIGMITLRVKRIIRLASRPANEIQNLPSVVLGKRKTGDLFIAFGNEVPVAEQHLSTWSVMAYEQEGPQQDKPKTYVSFVFRYRTRDFLEAQGIVSDSEKILANAPQKSTSRRIASSPISMRSLITSSPSPERLKNLDLSQRKKERVPTWNSTDVDALVVSLMLFVYNMDRIQELMTHDFSIPIHL